MIFLQSIPAVPGSETLIKNAFNLNADTVFGFLVTLLITVIIVFGTVIVYLWRAKEAAAKDMQLRYDNLAGQTVTVIQNNVLILTSIRDIVAETNKEMPGLLKEMENRLVREIDTTKEILGNTIKSIR